MEYPHGDLTGKIIGAAVEVHKALGPGLLESAYEQCLCHELSQLELSFERQVELPVTYKGLRLDAGYRMDVVVEKTVVVEVKSVEKVLPVREAQLLTYMKLGGFKVGLLVNSNEPKLVQGVVRRVL